jgi:hypothetical protein
MDGENLDAEKLFDEAFWVGIANRLPDLANDPEGTNHLVERYVAQYLPAHLRCKSQQDFDRVWLAFWHYLVAPRTNRKPFGLTSPTADLLIATFQGELSRPA